MRTTTDPSEQDTDDAAFVAEALRLNDRFTAEVVEAFNVCPYARGARLAGRTSREVLLQRDADPAPTLALIDRLEAEARPLDVVQVIYPRLCLPPREFEHFNTRVRNARAERIGTTPAYVHAAFHPDYPCDPRTPESLVAFFRRAPDPTIQLVRFAAIESIRGERVQGTVVLDIERFLAGAMPEPPALSPAERIARDNYALVAREGAARLEAIYAAIRDERRRAYARFGV